MFRIVLAGAVTSTHATLLKLLEHQMNIVGVLGYEPDDSSLVSGYTDLKPICQQGNIPYFPFKQIGHSDIAHLLNQLKPDLFFVVGLSQLVPESMLGIATMGNVGFHPTLLPRGRGRAPVAWLILEEKMGAANFFLMGAGADDGPVFVQEPFEVTDTDTAKSIEEKTLLSIGKALDKWLPELKKGIWNPVPQVETLATYFGRRTPADGCINWHDSAEYIDRLVRASAPPHPGAYTFLGDEKLKVIGSKIETKLAYRGVVGRILLDKSNSFLIQTGDGLIWLTEVMTEDGNAATLKVGQRLGYYPELEIYKLRKELKQLKEKIGL